MEFASPFFLQDMALRSPERWGTDADTLRNRLDTELFTPTGDLRPIYCAAALELLRHSYAAGDYILVVKSICRLAAAQLFLRISLERNPV